MMTKAQLKKIMEDNYIFNSDWMDAIQFVQDLLEYQADELKENEPYATVTINKLEEAIYEVFSLQSYVEDILEGDE